MGYLLAEERADYMAFLDADIVNFDREMLARLVLPALDPIVDFDFVKAYYARFSDRLHGRVTRLFVSPLLAAFTRCSDVLDRASRCRRGVPPGSAGASPRAELGQGLGRPPRRRPAVAGRRGGGTGRPADGREVAQHLLVCGGRARIVHPVSTRECAPSNPAMLECSSLWLVLGGTFGMAR
jgi:hypothetical protein